ncbi:MAG: DUF58 domain-containing protein [Acidobacteria bacterium]|nr:DUF58 domain-containing protein [Acidobacteriota bacterium]
MPAGLIFSILVMVVAVLALSSGNNLLYLLVSLLTGALIFSFFAARMVLSRVDIQLRYPECVPAGEVASFELMVVNRRRLFPVVSLVVTLIEQPPGMRGKVKVDQCYLPLLPRQTEALTIRERSFAQRGLWRIYGIRLESRFPFGLFEYRRSMEVEGDMRVHPPVRPLPLHLESLLREQGLDQTLSRGRGGDLHSIRDALGTDPHHHIDWKATARTSHLKVREFTDEEDRRVTILFDYSVQVTETKLLEAGVILVAGLVDRLIREGAAVRLVTPAQSTPFGSGSKQAAAIFDLLAELPLPLGTDTGRRWLELASASWSSLFSRSRGESAVREPKNCDWWRVPSIAGERVVVVVPSISRYTDLNHNGPVSLIACDQLPVGVLELLEVEPRGEAG